VFIIACSNVAILFSRAPSGEGELAIRAGSGRGRRRTAPHLLAESLILCVAGATLGVISARPLLAVLARYALASPSRSRPHRRLQHALVGAGLAVISAVLLAFVPRLPLREKRSQGFISPAQGVRITAAQVAAAELRGGTKSPRPLCSSLAPACC